MIFSTSGEVHLLVPDETDREIPYEIIREYSGGAENILAQRFGAAIVKIEHRYFGKSSPVRDLSTSNMQYNTPQNSIANNVNFARHVVFPFDPTSSSTALKTPWVIVGRSMSGASVAWTENLSPGTFWSYWGSSATSDGISSWSYSIPISEHMPQNCSLDVSRVIDYVDETSRSGTTKEKKKFQESSDLET